VTLVLVAGLTPLMLGGEELELSALTVLEVRTTIGPEEVVVGRIGLLVVTATFPYIRLV
jgi:hypothetical protein